MEEEKELPELSDALAEFGADGHVLRRVSRDVRWEGQWGLTPRACQGSSILGCSSSPTGGGLNVM